MQRNNQEGNNGGEEELSSGKHHPGKTVGGSGSDEDWDDHRRNRYGKGVDERSREVITTGSNRVTQGIDKGVLTAAKDLAVVIEGKRSDRPPATGKHIILRSEGGDEQTQNREEPKNDQDKENRVDRSRCFLVHLNTSCLANCLRLYHITGVTARTRTIAIAEPRP